MLYKKIHDSFHLTGREALSITILVLVFGFFCNLWMQRTEKTSDPNVFITYWGFPLEAIKIINYVSVGHHFDVGEVLSLKQTYEGLWIGIVVNVVIYITISTIIVKLATWIHDEVKYRRYY